MYDNKQLFLQPPSKAPSKLAGGSRSGLLDPESVWPSVEHITGFLMVSVLYEPAVGENVVNKSEDILDNYCVGTHRADYVCLLILPRGPSWSASTR